MREIKFRAWDRNIKKMVHQDEMSLAIFFEKISFRNIESTLGDNIELMQFTGLKDKNGNEIYEGDIVKGESTFKDVVEFEHGCFKFRYARFDFLYEYNVEVIGNIYENKELL